MKSRKKRGQSTAEYAILIGVVIAAIVAMQIYVKRGMQAKVKSVSDYFTNVTGDAAGTGVSLNTLSQYEPYYTSSEYAITQNRIATEAYKEGGITEKTGIKEETTRIGSQTVGVDISAGNQWR